MTEGDIEKKLNAAFQSEFIAEITIVIIKIVRHNIGGI